MIHVFLTLLLLAPAAFGEQTAPPPRSQASDAKTRDVYVTVTDSSAAPAQNLTVKDFAVREDGSPREVLRVAPATAPMQIAVLIDDSQASTPAVQQMREGLAAFVDKLDGKAEIAFVTVGERPTSLVEYTTSAAALKKGLGRLFARPGSGAYLLDGIIDVSRGLKKREATRPVIVALTFEGVEFSTRSYDLVLEELEASGAAFHVLAVGTPSSMHDDEMRNRNVVLAEGTSRTGGRREQLLTELAIPDRMKQLADELTHQYIVTYARSDTLIPPKRIDVSVTVPGLKARARTRLPSGKID